MWQFFILNCIKKIKNKLEGKIKNLLQFTMAKIKIQLRHLAWHWKHIRPSRCQNQFDAKTAAYLGADNNATCFGPNQPWLGKNRIENLKLPPNIIMHFVPLFLRLSNKVKRFWTVIAFYWSGQQAYHPPPHFGHISKGSLNYGQLLGGSFVQKHDSLGCCGFSKIDCDRSQKSKILQRQFFFW